MAKDDVQVNVRLPIEIVERVKAMAEINRRSMTAEIVARLADSFPPTLAEIEVDALRKEAEQVAAHDFRLKFDPRGQSKDKRDRLEHAEEVAQVQQRLKYLEREISDRYKAWRAQLSARAPD